MIRGVRTSQGYYCLETQNRTTLLAAEDPAEHRIISPRTRMPRQGQLNTRLQGLQVNMSAVNDQANGLQTDAKMSTAVQPCWMAFGNGYLLVPVDRSSHKSLVIRGTTRTAGVSALVGVGCFVFVCFAFWEASTLLAEFLACSRKQ